MSYDVNRNAILAEQTHTHFFSEAKGVHTIHYPINIFSLHSPKAIVTSDQSEEKQATFNFLHY